MELVPSDITVFILSRAAFVNISILSFSSSEAKKEVTFSSLNSAGLVNLFNTSVLSLINQRVEELKICQTVDTIKCTEEMEEEVDKLTKEKNEAFEESSRLKNEIIAMTERV